MFADGLRWDSVDPWAVGWWEWPPEQGQAPAITKGREMLPAPRNLWRKTLCHQTPHFSLSFSTLDHAASQTSSCSYHRAFALAFPSAWNTLSSGTHILGLPFHESFAPKRPLQKLGLPSALPRLSHFHLYHCLNTFVYCLYCWLGSQQFWSWWNWKLSLCLHLLFLSEW